MELIHLRREAEYHGSGWWRFGHLMMMTPAGTRCFDGAMTADEFDALAARLCADSATAALSNVLTALLPEARALYNAGDLVGLANLCTSLSERAWTGHAPGLAIRLLIAERAIARELGDRHRETEAIRFLAARNRLSTRFRIAEAWNQRLLRTELDEDTAFAHATAWRELAAIREVAAAYQEGIRYCEAAVEICERHIRQPGVASAQVKALLQKSVLHRLSGNLETARTTLLTARRLADTAEVEPLVRGLVSLREGGLDLVAGGAKEAMRSYRRAEQEFLGISENNRFIARVRQVTCLSRLDQAGDAVALAKQLATDYAADGYRLGQVLIEMTEVQQTLADLTEVRSTLERARPLYERSSTLEALRWRLHLARSILDLGEPAEQAAVQLEQVLTTAADPARADLTRTMLALFQVLRLPEPALVRPTTRVLALRAALAAADAQRTSLLDSDLRSNLHAQRESIYAHAVLSFAERGDSEAVVRAIEVGRADLLNQLLIGTPVAPEVPRPTAADSLPAIFAAARRVAAELRGDSPDASPAETDLLPIPGITIAADDLDRLADVLVTMQIWADPDEQWHVIGSTRYSGGKWQVDVRHATPAINRIIRRLLTDTAAGDSIRGSEWEDLGRFLLADDGIWAGSVDDPKSVVICPDPRLWQLPYGAIRRGPTFLADVASVRLTPSLRTLLLLHNRQEARTDDPRGPGVSMLDDGLPGHNDELAALDKWPNGHQRITDLGDLSAASLLYVSGFGEGPGAAGTLRADVTLGRLATASLPRLVILNGCWTGTAVSRYGTEPMSLAIGALRGGSDCVIAGTGQIGSVGSAMVASLCLGHIAAGVPVSNAVRQAQREVRHRHPELTPFEWAGLTTIGPELQIPSGSVHSTHANAGEQRLTSYL